MMSDPIITPPALVRGCNTPHGINVLSDWIEEQTGHPFDVDQSGWDTIYPYYFNGTCMNYENTSLGHTGFGDGCKDKYGGRAWNRDGYGYGDGDGYGNSQGDGWGYGHYGREDGSGGEYIYNIN